MPQKKEVHYPVAVLHFLSTQDRQMNKRKEHEDLEVVVVVVVDDDVAVEAVTRFQKTLKRNAKSCRHVKRRYVDRDCELTVTDVTRRRIPGQGGCLQELRSMQSKPAECSRRKPGAQESFRSAGPPKGPGRPVQKSTVLMDLV